MQDNERNLRLLLQAAWDTLTVAADIATAPVAARLEALAADVEALAADADPDGEPADEPDAPREVCPLCMERTGGLAEPPEGQHFELQLLDNIRVGGRIWHATGDGPCLAVVRSGLSPHHLLAIHDEVPLARQPLCLIAPSLHEVLVVDGEYDEGEGVDE